MFDRGEVAYSEADSAAGIVGYIVDYETRTTKTPDIDFEALGGHNRDEHRRARTTKRPNGVWWSCVQ